MDLTTVVKHIDASTAQAFVRAARHVIDALLIEGERVRQARPPEGLDYPSAGLSRSAPGGGWISDDELRETARRLGEAIAAEKWIDGLLLALRILTRVGG